MNIAEELELLISRRVRESNEAESEFKEKYEYLESTLREMIEDAKSLKQNMEDNGLTFGAIEAEGFLRFALSIESCLEG